MKTGGVSLNGVFVNQNRRINENKIAEKRTVRNTVEEKVDLSTKNLPPASQEDIMELVRKMDFAQIRSTNWLSKNGAAQLSQLLES